MAKIGSDVTIQRTRNIIFETTSHQGQRCQHHVPAGQVLYRIYPKYSDGQS